MNDSLWGKQEFGRTGLGVSRLAIGSSYGIGGADLERAFERGINFFFWGLRRTDGFADGVRAIASKHRDEMIVAVQSYSRSAVLLRRWFDAALRRLRIDAVDILTLSWWNDVPPARIVDAARALQAAGKTRHLMISCHVRPTFQRFVVDPTYGAIMVRYNAGHPGAEREVFPYVREPRPGVLAFTATRWGTLLKPELTPPGERTPTATDCYRFVLTNPAVDVSLTGPKNGAELGAAFDALDRGPMSADELAWMKRVGATVRDRARRASPVFWLDRIGTAVKRAARGTTGANDR